MNLSDIAQSAGVTVQTVLRKFGSKEGLFLGLAEHESARVTAEREEVPSGASLAEALETLVAHYERDGDLAIHLLAQEERFELIAQVVEGGRRSHRQWVKTHCVSVLGTSKGSEREKRLVAAIAATDVYVWKLLRRDFGLSRARTLDAMRRLLCGLDTKESN